jgi:hypothetical protein
MAWAGFAMLTPHRPYRIGKSPILTLRPVAIPGTIQPRLGFQPVLLLPVIRKGFRSRPLQLPTTQTTAETTLCVAAVDLTGA